MNVDENKKSSQVAGTTSEERKDYIDYYLKEQSKSLIMAILALVIAIFTFVITIVSIL